MLLNKLNEELLLNDFIEKTCCENDVCVDFDENLDENDYLVIKVDDFYANQVLENQPKSPDCLVVQRCKNGHFHIHIVELKNVKTSANQNLNRKDIREKFETCLRDFMSNRFRNYFYDEAFELDLRLYLVAGKVTSKMERNFKFDFLLGIPRLEFANKKYMIQGENPNPMIQAC